MRLVYFFTTVFTKMRIFCEFHAKVKNAYHNILQKIIYFGFIFQKCIIDGNSIRNNVCLMLIIQYEGQYGFDKQIQITVVDNIREKSYWLVLNNA